MHAPSYDAFFASWRQKPLILPVCLGAAFLITVLLLQLTTPRYTVTAIVGPTAREGAAARSTRLPASFQDDDTVSLSLIERSDDETLSDFARFMQLMTTPEIAQRLLDDTELDLRSHMTPGTGPRAWLDKAARFLAGQKTSRELDAAALARILRQRLTLNMIGRSAMREIVLRDADRDFAVKLVNALIAAADNHLKEQAMQRTASQIVYLRRALERVTMTEHRKTLASLLGLQEQTQMMLAVHLPFAADVIQTAQAPHAPDWPPAALCFAVALSFGFLAACSLHYFRATSP